MDRQTPDPGVIHAGPSSLADAQVPEISSDDELEMALPAIPEPQEDELLVDRPVEPASNVSSAPDEQQCMSYLNTHI